MKKLIALTLAMVLIFTFAAACGKKDEGKLICGITDFKPMNYLENGEWTGFDTEFAKLVGEKLGMEIEFVEIEWDNKYAELESGTIDCIWNGFTANKTDDDGIKRSDKVDMSYGYMLNQQCIVVKAENVGSYISLDDLKGKTVAAERGSAGETVVKNALGGTGEYIDTSSQRTTFTEVLAGTADCAVVDILLARSMVGTGDLAGLAIAEVDTPSEIYAIGFKKGSDLTEKANKAMEELFNEGKMDALAKKYDVENSLSLDKNPKF